MILDLFACGLFLWSGYLWFETKDVAWLIICVWLSLERRIVKAEEHLREKR